MSDYRDCEFCQGTGWDEDIDPDGVVDGFTEECWYCQGRGEVEDTCHCAAYCVCACDLVRDAELLSICEVY